MGRVTGAARAAVIHLSVGCACLAAGCTTDGPQPGLGFAAGVVTEDAAGGADPAIALYDDNVAYPGRSIYACEDGETLTVDNTVAAVHIALPDGSAMDMPASPPDSRNRYVSGQNALVLDGDEALYMRPKTPPVVCRRSALQASID